VAYGITLSTLMKSIRPYWSNFYENTDAIVFVIDSADETRFSESKDELCKLLNVLNDKD